MIGDSTRRAIHADWDDDDLSGNGLETDIDDFDDDDEDDDLADLDDDDFEGDDDLDDDDDDDDDDTDYDDGLDFEDDYDLMARHREQVIGDRSAPLLRKPRDKRQGTARERLPRRSPRGRTPRDLTRSNEEPDLDD